MPWLIAVLALSAVSATAAQNAAPEAPGGVVRAVMFWSDSCPHCHHVIDNVLPPLQERYEERFELHLVEMRTSADYERLARVASAYDIPRDQVGVPFLVIGDRALVGSAQIPEQLPGLIERHLDAGGLNYPDVAPLAEVLPDDAGVASDGSERDASGALPPVSVSPHGSTAEGLVVPLTIAGLGVAGYLAYVETAAVPAVCGPIGDCNAVQLSPYAKLFGIPIGVLGVLGYVAILAVWLWGQRSEGTAGWAPLAAFAMALGGVLFSIYLTYLEPFVINAVCAWCLTSAVIMSLLLLCTLDPALRAIPQSVQKSGK